MNLTQFTSEQVNQANTTLGRAKAQSIAELFRQIGAKGYGAICARIQLVELIWDCLEELHNKLPMEKRFLSWHRFAFYKTFNAQNCLKLLQKENTHKKSERLIDFTVIWCVPLLDNSGMKISTNTYFIWHDLAKHQKVLELYKPATTKDARKIISAVKNGDEKILIEYCIDDEETIVDRTKEAAKDDWNSRDGLEVTGRKEVDPARKALLQFYKASSNCLALGIDLEQLQQQLLQIAKQ